MLFIGGPLNMRNEEIPEDRDYWRVQEFAYRRDISWMDSEVVDHVYRRVRMGYADISQVRSCMVVAGMSVGEARELLLNHLGRLWIEEAPDATPQTSPTVEEPITDRT